MRPQSIRVLTRSLLPFHCTFLTANIEVSVPLSFDSGFLDTTQWFRRVLILCILSGSGSLFFVVKVGSVGPFLNKTLF